MEAVPDDAPKDKKKSASALAEFKVACKLWLPKMNEDHRHDAMMHCVQLHDDLHREAHPELFGKPRAVAT
jgi:hypothetical protein